MVQTIFPEEGKGNKQDYRISMGELYANDPNAKMDPDTELKLRISNLREICKEALNLCGLQPDT